jgi:hypothetical protein
MMAKGGWGSWIQERLIMEHDVLGTDDHSSH